MREAVAKLNRNFIPPTGMLPINVPGAVDGWTSLHDKFGKLTLADDLSGAIGYAENGFPVTQTIAYYWARNLHRVQGPARRVGRDVPSPRHRPRARRG